MKRVNRLNLALWKHSYKKWEIIGFFLFVVVYFVWFFILEYTSSPKYYIYSWIDDMIPFCEYFIVPYYVWFFFIPSVIIYFFFASPDDFRRIAACAAAGMIICLLVYTFYPNGQQLRPESFQKDNIFTSMVAHLYRTDTPTNVCPSIHAFNTFAVEVGIFKARVLKGKRVIKIYSFILSALIIASVVLIKQHSIIDVFYAALLAAVIFSIQGYRSKRKCIH